MKSPRYPSHGLIAIAALPFSQSAIARDAQYDALVATHAKANNLPEALVHRVIVRESGYRPGLVSRGNIGLMQIKLGTARSLGYTGTAEGLRDPDTNLTWAVKYLAGAYRAANGDHSRAVHYYASGYYCTASASGSAYWASSPRPGWKKRPAPTRKLRKAQVPGRHAVHSSILLRRCRTHTASVRIWVPVCRRR